MIGTNEEDGLIGKIVIELFCIIVELLVTVIYFVIILMPSTNELLFAGPIGATDVVVVLKPPLPPEVELDPAFKSKPSILEPELNVGRTRLDGWVGKTTFEGWLDGKNILDGWIAKEDWLEIDGKATISDGWLGKTTFEGCWLVIIFWLFTFKIFTVWGLKLLSKATLLSRVTGATVIGFIAILPSLDDTKLPVLLLRLELTVVGSDFD